MVIIFNVEVNNSGWTCYNSWPSSHFQLPTKTDPDCWMCPWRRDIGRSIFHVICETSGWSHSSLEATFYRLYLSISCSMRLAGWMCKDCDVWYVCSVSADHVYGLRGDRQKEQGETERERRQRGQWIEQNNTEKSSWDWRRCLIVWELLENSHFFVLFFWAPTVN